MLRFNNYKGLDICPSRAFQYILCYGSTIPAKANKTTTPIFQYILCYGSTFTHKFIIIVWKKFQYILCYGSTNFIKQFLLPSFSFQYILCYGSTLWKGLFRMSLYPISIHLMLRFNDSKRPDYKAILKFQYILCYGSTGSASKK